ncbi:Ger(x)C family spore germination protein [Ferviditalea candida]|uniref:Ger(X)C family spore germination protein n=1 Tax=Ferviditalea candida TaxID=3108399 RepID=A0ABU5ZJ96_9BACL|nr:Ger(x)C family spore germination protein [Paenibacillaceae bacterium T2]
MRWIKLILLFCFLNLSTGCWDLVEIDDQALVMASGLDYAENNQVEVTLQFALPAGIATTQGGVGKTVMAITEKGKDGLAALQKIQEQLPRKIFLGHRSIVVIGEKYARHGIEQVLDEFMRSPYSRSNTYILTAHGTTAKELLQTPFLYEQIPAIGLKKNQLGGFSLSIKLPEFLNAIASYGRSPITGAVRLIDNTSEGKLFRIDEVAVYRENKLSGFLAQREANSLFWLPNGPKHNDMTIKVKEKTAFQKGTITCQILRPSAKIHADIKKGKPSFTFDLKVSGRVMENDSNLDLSSVSNLKLVENKFSEHIEQLSRRTIQQLQQKLKTDALGFGEVLHREHPYYWKKIKEQWEQDLYPNVPVAVKVDVNIERIGRTQGPAHLKQKDILK